MGLSNPMIKKILRLYTLTSNFFFPKKTHNEKVFYISGNEAF